MTKRILSMILALSMMLSLVPVSAFADTGSVHFAAPDLQTFAETENGEGSASTVSTDLRINKNGYPYKYTEGQAADNLKGNATISDGTGWYYDGETKTLHLTSGSYYFGAQGDDIPTGYAFAGHPACEDETEHEGCSRFYRIALACSVEIAAGANVYAIGMREGTKLTNSGTADEVSGSDENSGSITIINNESGTIQHLYLGCKDAAGSVKNHGTITDSMLGNFIIENDGTIKSTLLSGCRLVYFLFNSFSKCAFLTADENTTLQSANLVVLRYGKDASGNYYGWFDFGYGEQHYAYFQDGFALTDEDSDPLFSTETSMDNIFSINGNAVKDAAERSYFTYDSDNDCYALTTLPAAGTVLELNAPVSLTIDEATHLPKTDLAYQDSHGLYCGPGWKFQPANAEDGTEALLYLTADTDLSKQPAVGCKVQVYAGITIAGGTFAEQVSGYVDKDSGTTAQYKVSGGVFLSFPKNYTDAANYNYLTIEPPTGTSNTLNGISWASTAYVYGDSNNITLTYSSSDSNTHLVPYALLAYGAVAQSGALTEAQKDAIHWKDENGTASMTVDFNMDVGGEHSTCFKPSLSIPILTAPTFRSPRKASRFWTTSNTSVLCMKATDGSMILTMIS